MSSACSQTNPIFLLPSRGWSRLAFCLTLAIACIALLAPASFAQSTFGSVLGTVKDPSGSAVPKATVEITNVGTNAKRSVVTNDAGGYQFVNVEQGSYKVKVTATGFETIELTAFALDARETKRWDPDMKLASQATTVTVEATSVRCST